jgi:ferredoxin--NADP+ reductase
MTPELVAELRQKHYNATVAHLRKVHSDLMIIRVRPDKPRQVHQPGQYTSLGLGHWEPRFPGCQDEPSKPEDEGKIVRRAYSISCSVVDDGGKDLMVLEKNDWIEFYIVLVRDSDKEKPPALTPRLFMLREGDRLNMVDKITGHYTLEGVSPTDTVLFLSTGTGEAPHNYMLWQLLRGRHQGKILAACCVRFRRDLGYLPIQQELMKQYPNYKYLSLTTREPDTVNQKVYIQDLITSGELEGHLGAPLDATRTHVYLCGNPKMIGIPEKDPETGALRYPKTLGVIEILEKRGFKTDQGSKERGNIHFEKYW